MTGFDYTLDSRSLQRLALTISLLSQTGHVQMKPIGLMQPAVNCAGAFKRREENRNALNAKRLAAGKSCLVRGREDKARRFPASI